MSPRRDLALVESDGHTPDGEAVAAGCFSVQQAAAFAGVSRATLYGFMGDGRLAYVKLGRRRLVPRVALEKLLADHLRGGHRT